MRCFLLVSDVMHNHSFGGVITEMLQVLVLRTVEAGTVLVDVGEVAVAEDAGIGMRLLQATEQA